MPVTATPTAHAHCWTRTVHQDGRVERSWGHWKSDKNAGSRRILLNYPRGDLPARKKNVVAGRWPSIML